jgi:hypothetical protein
VKVNFHFKMNMKICSRLSVQVVNRGGQEMKVRAVYISPLPTHQICTRLPPSESLVHCANLSSPRRQRATTEFGNHLVHMARGNFPSPPFHTTEVQNTRGMGPHRHSCQESSPPICPTENSGTQNRHTYSPVATKMGSAATLDKLPQQEKDTGAIRLPPPLRNWYGIHPITRSTWNTEII